MSATFNLISAGAAREPITPPLEVGFLTSSIEGTWAPFQRVRKPLYARALVLEGAASASGAGHRRAVAAALLWVFAGRNAGLGALATHYAGRSNVARFAAPA